MAIQNPTVEQVEKALALVEPPNVITDTRYAMAMDGCSFATVKDGLNLAVGINLIKAVRQIFVYGGLEKGTTASVTHTLVDIDMYPKHRIIESGFNPVHPSDIPRLFANMQTTIYEV